MKRNLPVHTRLNLLFGSFASRFSLLILTFLLFTGSVFYSIRHLSFYVFVPLFLLLIFMCFTGIRYWRFARLLANGKIAEGSIHKSKRTIFGNQRPAVNEYYTKYVLRYKDEGRTEREFVQWSTQELEVGQKVTVIYSDFSPGRSKAIELLASGEYKLTENACTGSKPHFATYFTLVAAALFASTAMVIIFMGS